MGYDLYVLAADAPLTFDAAVARLEALDDNTNPRVDDPRLTRFEAAMRARFPEAFPDPEDVEEWEPGPGFTFFELGHAPGLCFVGIPFGLVGTVGRAAQAEAGALGLTIVDPQAEDVVLPPAFGGSEVDWGPEQTEDDRRAEAAAWDRELERAIQAAQSGRTEADATPVGDIAAQLLRDMANDGVRMTSSLGYDLTEETIREEFDDPTRLPPSFQTAERKAQLLRDLRSTKRSVRTIALGQLGGWDPDPDVAEALRALLASDDPDVRWMAATGVERQGDTSAFESLLEVIRRASPAEGGSVGHMLLPVRSALTIAGRISPEAVDRVRRLVADWRGPQPARPRQFDRDLDELLASS